MVTIKTQNLYTFFLYLEKLYVFVKQNAMWLAAVFYLSSKCSLQATALVVSPFHTVIWGKLRDLF